MKINPQQKLRNTFFYNNLCIIVCLFCIICFITSISYQTSSLKKFNFPSLKEGAKIGPIKVQNKSEIYKIIVSFKGNNSSTYISGEVLDKDKDTLYEFGKDLWHESGYDSEGYWSESDRKMTAYLTFGEKGVYYIQFRTDENSIRDINITIEHQRGSYIAHFKVGTLFLLIIMIVGYFINTEWINTKVKIIYEKILEYADD